MDGRGGMSVRVALIYVLHENLSNGYMAHIIPKIGIKMINLLLSLFKVYPNKRIKSQTYE